MPAMPRFLRESTNRQRGLMACSGMMAWCVLLVWTWNALLIHAYQPQPFMQANADPITLEPANGFRLVLFAHPFCPCTRATLHELEESQSRFPAETAVTVVFVTARLDAAKVRDSDIVRRAQHLPNVAVHFDPHAQQASRFRASVSGELFAFNPAGRLVYHGGLTPARGHQGDAEGQLQLERLILGRSSAQAVAPVFGCKLPTSTVPPATNP